MIIIEEDFSLIRNKPMNLEHFGILPFKLSEIEVEEMEQILYELYDYPHTRAKMENLFKQERYYRNESCSTD